MSKELEVSLVNYLCPVCGNIAEEGIIMNSLLSEEAAKEVKNLHGKTVGYSDHACKECAKYKDKALFIIGIDAEKSKKEPWRTGDIIGIKGLSFSITYKAEYQDIKGWNNVLLHG